MPAPRARRSIPAAVLLLTALALPAAVTSVPQPLGVHGFTETGTGARASAAQVCQRDRAVPHRPGGVRVDPRTVPPGPRPCMARTGVPSWEPTVGVTKEGWVLTGGDGASALRAGPVGVGGILVTVARSKDAGRTWEDVSPVDVPSPLGDPYLFVDRKTGRTFLAGYKSYACYQLWWSDDAGDSWLTNPNVCGLTDHEHIFTAPPVRSVTVGYPNVVYMCALQGGIGTAAKSNLCLKSLDGGLSFAPSGTTPFPTAAENADGGLGQGIGGPDGTIYIPKGFNGRPHLAISRDEGLTWEQHRVADSEYQIDRGPFGGPHYAHQSSVALDTAGNLYFTWVDRRWATMLAVSRDGGKTWGRPMMVSAPGLALSTLTTIDAHRPGEVAVAYMGLRQGARGWDGFMTVSSNALSGRPLFYSASVNPANDPLVRGLCGPIRCEGAGDFFDVEIGPDGRAWASLVDACSRTCARGGRDDIDDGIVGSLALPR